MTQGARTMIVMDAGDSRFQFRAGALIHSNGHILIHRAVTDPFWVLPGGRVEFHEAGAETLAREIEEEIGSSAVIGPLRFVVENFFELAGRKVHEVGFYYEAELARPLPFHESDIVHRVRDGSADLEFRWALPSKAVLDQFDLMPLPLRGLIETMPSGVQHMVRRGTT
ncbi:NUDIX domain-containing protein [Agrobacterium rhizogenes]|uniref:NUDIX hydrolase n=1 Tax=Rhizobium TaxID=379 RepID=UPI00058657B2|nr:MULTISPECIES: NUDIX domain-containing protein [Rhizobium]OCJ14928.1 NUDIX hydrolase [Agrobacterium sp. B133/95]OCJ25533.1 NUDIX hydrolase [Agrobacterium sp. B131/95]MDJ1632211.1 NUDIX domain-containing protein [Rhizobium rhizogenes]NTG73532.1 NUDIX domain-containing protein [Rhizobium rhizogenes]NTI41396.1 NUDIX domain-containing protein [Rhizobium rhizogenes]